MEKISISDMRKHLKVSPSTIGKVYCSPYNMVSYGREILAIDFTGPSTAIVHYQNVNRRPDLYTEYIPLDGE